MLASPMSLRDWWDKLRGRSSEPPVPPEQAEPFTYPSQRPLTEEEQEKRRQEDDQDLEPPPPPYQDPQPPPP
jgi:hypothetical protein